MTPEEFFDSVAKVNAEQAVAEPGSLRLAVNAIMTLDAFFGILHEALYSRKETSIPSDDQWKETRAKESPDYRLLRDCAYALKHGKLDGRKFRLVHHPAQIETFPASYDSAAFDRSAYDTETVWIDTPENDFRADVTIKNVCSFAKECLEKHPSDKHP